MLAHYYYVVYFRQGLIFTVRAISKAVEIQINKTMVKPAVVCGSETWHMPGVDMKRLKTWERKILRRIYGPLVEQVIWRIRTNRELWELCKGLAILADIKKKKAGMNRTSSKNGSWEGS
jgi:hypothetical protein